MRICYPEIDELQQEFSKVKASLENEIAKLGETFNSFSLDTETYDGQSATAMRSYIQNVHGSVLDLFEVLGFQMELSIRMYADNFGSQVDASEKAILQTEYIDNVLTQMLACRDTFDSIDVAVKSLAGEYSEFISSAPTNGGLIFENFNEALRFIDKTSNSVGEFDSSMSGCFTAVNELILAIYQACQTKIPYNEVAKDFAYSKDMSFPWMEVLEKPIDFSSLSNLHLSALSENEIPKKSVYYYYDEIANRFVSQTVEAEICKNFVMHFSTRSMSII